MLLVLSTHSKLNIETYTDEQLMEFGKSNKDETRQKQRTKYNNDFDFRDIQKEHRKTYCEKQLNEIKVEQF